MNDLFSRQVKAEDVTVKSFQRLDSIRVSGDHYAASYRSTLVLPDGSELQASTFSVDRSIDSFKDDGINFNGVNITLNDFISIGAQLAEKWRVLDEAARAKAVQDIAAAGIFATKVP